MGQPHDPETGEVTEEAEEAEDETEFATAEIGPTLSQRATATITRPDYWRRVEAIQGDGGPDYEEAFFHAQSEIDSIIEADKDNPHFKSKYASLAGNLARVRPVLTKYKLTIKQFPGRIHRLGVDGNKQMFLPIVTSLTHYPSGQGEAFIWEMPIEKITPIAIGSLFTFARRYAVAGIFGIATVDDDAAATSIRNKIDGQRADEILETITEQIKATTSLADLKKWLKANNDGFEDFPDDRMEKIKKIYEDHRSKLIDAEETQDPVKLVKRDKKSSGGKSDEKT